MADGGLRSEVKVTRGPGAQRLPVQEEPPASIIFFSGQQTKEPTHLSPN